MVEDGHTPDEAAASLGRAKVNLHAACVWGALDLGHGLHETKPGIRFTISDSSRCEVLTRLLKLSHEGDAAEVAQGLHDKKGKTKNSASRKRSRQKEAASVRHAGKLIED